MDEMNTMGANDVTSLINQGNAYYYGEGVAMDLTKACDCYEQAAQLGSPQAQCLLGYCLKKGIGRDANPSKAFELFTASAGAGFPMAMYNLGECYEKGLGCQPDPEKSAYYYQQAKDLGYLE